MLSNLILSIWLQYSKSQDIGKLLFFELFDPHGIGSDDYVIVVGISGELGILFCYLGIQSCGIFDRESLKVQLSQQVDVLVIDLS